MKPDDDDKDKKDEDKDETNLSENESDFNDLETENDESNWEPELVQYLKIPPYPVNHLLSSNWPIMCQPGAINYPRAIKKHLVFSFLEFLTLICQL